MIDALNRALSATPTLDLGQREAVEEAIAWAVDDGLPGTAEMLRSILAAPTPTVAADAAAPSDEAPLAKSHCQNGGDVCLAGNRDGVCCPEDSCDIDDGTRKNPVERSGSGGGEAC